MMVFRVLVLYKKYLDKKKFGSKKILAREIKVSKNWVLKSHVKVRSATAEIFIADIDKHCHDIFCLDICHRDA